MRNIPDREEHAILVRGVPRGILSVCHGRWRWYVAGRGTISWPASMKQHEVLAAITRICRVRETDVATAWVMPPSPPPKMPV